MDSNADESSDMEHSEVSRGVEPKIPGVTTGLRVETDMSDLESSYKSSFHPSS